MANPSPYLPLISRAAAQYGVDPRLLAAQINQESGFNPNARSPAGALGISQFMPGTAKGLGIDPMNPNQAIAGQAKYMKNLLNSYHGNEQMALAAYNAGSGAVAKYHGIPPYAETRNYVKAIEAGKSQFPGLSGGVPTASPHPSTITTPTVNPTQPTPSQGNDPTQTRNALLAYLMTSSANTANGGAGGDPNAGLVSLLSSLPTTASLPSHVNGVPLEPTSPSAANKAAGNPNVQGFVNIAKHFIGTPYSWGGGGVNGPSRGFAQGAKTVGFDCSSFVQYVWNKAAGVNIPRTTYSQFKSGSPVQRNKLQPGDAVYFEPSSQGPQHVGMYIGQGQFIESPHTGASIRISNLNQRSDYVGARRFARGS